MTPCNACGAIVFDIEKHTALHESVTILTVSIMAVVKLSGIDPEEFEKTVDELYQTFRFVAESQADINLMTESTGHLAEEFMKRFRGEDE